MLETARRYREIALSLLRYAEETEIAGPRDACIGLAVVYQESAREIELRHKGRQASMFGSGSAASAAGGTEGVAA